MSSLNLREELSINVAKLRAPHSVQSNINPSVLRCRADVADAGGVVLTSNASLVEPDVNITVARDIEPG